MVVSREETAHYDREPARGKEPMTCRCPQHGFQLCALVSPDLAHSEMDASQLRLVALFSHYEWGAKCEVVVTMTEAFAQQHDITQSEMDYETVFVESEWYEQLH